MRAFFMYAAMPVALCLLAGCGSSQPGRTEGGMATGAATGAAVGLIGGPVGVVIGAAVGAGAGALASVNTRPDQVNLGSPPWSGSSAAPAASQPSASGQPVASNGASVGSQASGGGTPASAGASAGPGMPIPLSPGAVSQNPLGPPASGSGVPSQVPQP